MLRRSLILVWVVFVAATHASPVAASQGTAATVNLNYEGPGPLHAPKIVNGINYQYDANGNLTDDGQRTYEWNLENKPQSITQALHNTITQFVYDGDGRRIIKNLQSQNSKLVYANQYLQINPDTQESTYYYPIPPATAIRDSQGTRFLHPDHLGSTRLVSNDQGQPSPASTISYFPYGNLTTDSIAQLLNNTKYLYTGQEFDAETGLYNLNARFYNPTTATFLSPDVLSGLSNRYQYSLANPIRFADPSGLQPYGNKHFQEKFGVSLKIEKGVTVSDLQLQNLSDWLANRPKEVQKFYSEQPVTFVITENISQRAEVVASPWRGIEIRVKPELLVARLLRKIGPHEEGHALAGYHLVPTGQIPTETQEFQKVALHYRLLTPKGDLGSTVNRYLYEIPKGRAVDELFAEFYRSTLGPPEDVEKGYSATYNYTTIQGELPIIKEFFAALRRGETVINFLERYLQRLWEARQKISKVVGE